MRFRECSKELPESHKPILMIGDPSVVWVSGYYMATGDVHWKTYMGTSAVTEKAVEGQPFFLAEVKYWIYLDELRTHFGLTWTGKDGNILVNAV